MPDLSEAADQSEEQFAKMVDALSADSGRPELLADLLRENHPAYDQRSAAAIVRMRGWVLLALARTGVSDRELPFVLEELVAGTDAYLTAAATRALRSYAQPNAALAPFVMHALANISDEPLSFENYGEYATSSTDTTAVRELLAALAWLGATARNILPELTSLRAEPGRFSKSLAAEVDRIIAAIDLATPKNEEETSPCCTLPLRLGQRLRTFQNRPAHELADSIVFEDQHGKPLRFQEFFRGRPSIVVFFYTRCDNPWKCSLTVSKLARVQQLLRQRGVDDQIQAAAITYDPGFDGPQQLLGYGQDRGINFDARNRMLRTTQGFAALREYFNLGVNFIGSLVNRHRIELYILDRQARIAASFERLHWDESQVVDRAVELLQDDAASPRAPRSRLSEPKVAATTITGTLASLAWAFFPKCPMCWAAYLSVFGIAGIEKIFSSSKMQVVLVGMMLINIVSVWFRGRATRRMSGFYLVCAGVVTIILGKAAAWDQAAVAGVLLTVTGSLWSAVDRRKAMFYLHRIWARLFASRLLQES